MSLASGHAAKAKGIFHFSFTLHPAPLNICSLGTTRIFAAESSHPLHLKTVRRLAAFNAEKLHWTVKSPATLGSKVVVRNWAVRRVKEAFRAELKARGWANDGTPLEKRDGGLPGLKGALALFLSDDQSVVVASGEEVRLRCAWLVRKVEEMQKVGEGGRATGKRKRHSVRSLEGGMKHSSRDVNR